MVVMLFVEQIHFQIIDGSSLHRSGTEKNQFRFIYLCTLCCNQQEFDN